jgi:hypothetical protein
LATIAPTGNRMTRLDMADRRSDEDTFVLLQQVSP